MTSATIGDVDPVFGSLSDFDAVMRRPMGIGVESLIDLVFPDTSDQHPVVCWRAVSNAANDKSIGLSGAGSKTAMASPNNWLSDFRRLGVTEAATEHS